MEDMKTEQLEALTVLVEFNERLLKNMNIIVKEFSGERLEDTNNFLKGIVDAINWEVQVMNATMDILNEKQITIDKEDFNEKVIALSDAIVENDDAKMAVAMKNLIPMFEGLGAAATMAIAS